MRNINIGKPAIANRLHIGEVVRYIGNIYIHNLEGRKTNAEGSSLRISDARHVGMTYHAPDCMSNPPLPRHVHIVYIDVRKVRWCSAGSVAFHSFSWPRNTKEATGIARTLFIYHCKWAGVLVVHGRCFGSSGACFRSNRVLDNLLWNWSKTGRPYVACTEGSVGIGGGDPVPAWFDGWCV